MVGRARRYESEEKMHRKIDEVVRELALLPKTTQKPPFTNCFLPFRPGCRNFVSHYTIQEMEMLTLYTIASLAFATVTLVGGGKWKLAHENRKLKRVLKTGKEYEALILDAQPVRPSIFNTENIRLKVQILMDKPLVVEFDYDATYPEWRELMTGKVIKVDIDPADPHNVLIIRKSSRPSKRSSATNSVLLAF